MKRHLLLLALAFPFAVVAQSGPRTLEQVEVVRSSGAMLVDCTAPRWPTVHEVADYNGISVFDLVPDVRTRIAIVGSRACRHGAAQVRVVFDQPGRAVAVVPDPSPGDGG